MVSEASNPAVLQGGGFRCPRCQGFIGVTLQEVLGSPHVSCSQCGLELAIDPARSAAAMAELRKLAASTTDASRILDRARSPQPGRD
jgi:hypothetical protein